jgi:hypothetical protein
MDRLLHLHALDDTDPDGDGVLCLLGPYVHTRDGLSTHYVVPLHREVGRFPPGHGDPEPGAFVQRQRIEQPTLETDLTGARHIAATAHDQTGQRGLVGAVGNEQRADFPWLRARSRRFRTILVLYLKDDVAYRKQRHCQRLLISNFASF